MICVPVMARDNAEAIRKMTAAASADLIEIRLDVMDAFDLNEIIRKAPKPLIITYRSKKEGGNGLASYETRVQILLQALTLGVDFVDVEFSMPQIYRQEIFQAKGSSKLILSVHMPNKTPSREVLENMLKKMAATGADIIKIITYAGNPEDNLSVLGLIPLAKELGVRIITFCMGPEGRISRIFSLLLGGYLSFASLEEGQESAAGQIPLQDMKKILRILS